MRRVVIVVVLVLAVGCSKDGSTAATTTVDEEQVRIDQFDEQTRQIAPDATDAERRRFGRKTCDLIDEAGGFRRFITEVGAQVAADPRSFAPFDPDQVAALVRASVLTFCPEWSEDMAAYEVDVGS